MTKKTKNGRAKRGEAQRNVLQAIDKAGSDIFSVWMIRVRLGNGRLVPYSPVAQVFRRLRLAGLIRRADGLEGPGIAATYALTAKGRKVAERSQTTGGTRW